MATRTSPRLPNPLLLIGRLCGLIICSTPWGRRRHTLVLRGHGTYPAFYEFMIYDFAPPERVHGIPLAVV